MAVASHSQIKLKMFCKRTYPKYTNLFCSGRKHLTINLDDSQGFTILFYLFIFFMTVFVGEMSPETRKQ